MVTHEELTSRLLYAEDINTDLQKRLRVEEHSTTQLAKETETIGEYIILYQQHRQEMTQRLRQREEQIETLQRILVQHGVQPTLMDTEKHSNATTAPPAVVLHHHQQRQSHPQQQQQQLQQFQQSKPRQSKRQPSRDTGNAKYGKRNNKTGIFTL